MTVVVGLCKFFHEDYNTIPREGYSTIPREGYSTIPRENYNTIPRENYNTIPLWVVVIKKRIYWFFFQK